MSPEYAFNVTGIRTLPKDEYIKEIKSVSVDNVEEDMYFLGMDSAEEYWDIREKIWNIIGLVFPVKKENKSGTV